MTVDSCLPQVQPAWVRGEASQEYWENEWQRVPHTQEALFEHLCLLIFQNGLWWEVVLRKREELRDALAGFCPEQLAGFTDQDVETLVSGQGGIRNRAKIEACVHNARVIQERDLHLPHLMEEAFPVPLLLPAGSPLPRTVAPCQSLAARGREYGLRRAGEVVWCSLAQAAGYITWEGTHLAGNYPALSK